VPAGVPLEVERAVAGAHRREWAAVVAATASESLEAEQRAIDLTCNEAERAFLEGQMRGRHNPNV
jgi:hypothetical protein